MPSVRVCTWSRKYTGLVKIMLRLMDYTVVSSDPREMCVRALNGTVACWLLCVNRLTPELFF